MFLRGISALITFIFLIQSAGFSQIQSLNPSVPALIQIQIPRDLGDIESSALIPDNSNCIVHIQDAHGSYQAQKNIENIIRYLSARYGFKQLMLEGGAGKLDPAQFHFFSDRKQDFKVADLLMKRGAFTGAENFLLSGTAQGYGIEDPALYRKNFDCFEKAINARPQADAELATRKAETRDLANRIFSKELQNVVRAWELHEDGQSDWRRYLSFLGAEAQKTLALDLKDSKYQIEFPALVRYFNLKEPDAEKVELERKVFFEFLKGKISEDLYDRLSRFEKETSNSRFLFEELHDELLKKKTQLPGLPNFFRYIGNRILQSEISSKELSEEMTRLAERLFAKLMKTPEEKQLMQQIREQILLEKLVHLELTREEWVLLSSRQKPESSVFLAAIEFYRAAEERESAFLKNIETVTKQNRIYRAIIVTGGFHNEGLESQLKQQGYAFITIRPNFTDTENSRKNYLQAMLPEKSELVRALELNAPEAFERLLPPQWITRYRGERNTAIQEVSAETYITAAASLGKEQENSLPGREWIKTFDQKLKVNRENLPVWISKNAYGSWAVSEFGRHRNRWVVYGDGEDQFTVREQPQKNIRESINVSPPIPLPANTHFDREDVAFSENGSLVAALFQVEKENRFEGPQQYRVRIYQVEKGKLLREFVVNMPQEGPRHKIALSPDGNQLAILAVSLSGEDLIQIYDTQTGQLWRWLSAPTCLNEMWFVSNQEFRALTGYQNEAVIYEYDLRNTADLEKENRNWDKYLKDIFLERFFRVDKEYRSPLAYVKSAVGFVSDLFEASGCLVVVLGCLAGIDLGLEHMHWDNVRYIYEGVIITGVVFLVGLFVYSLIHGFVKGIKNEWSANRALKRWFTSPEAVSKIKESRDRWFERLMSEQRAGLRLPSNISRQWRIALEAAHLYSYDENFKPAGGQSKEDWLLEQFLKIDKKHDDAQLTLLNYTFNAAMTSDDESLMENYRRFLACLVVAKKKIDQKVIAQAKALFQSREEHENSSSREMEKNPARNNNRAIEGASLGRAVSNPISHFPLLDHPTGKAYYPGSGSDMVTVKDHLKIFPHLREFWFIEPRCREFLKSEAFDDLASRLRAADFVIVPKMPSELSGSLMQGETFTIDFRNREGIHYRLVIYAGNYEDFVKDRASDFDVAIVKRPGYLGELSDRGDFWNSAVRLLQDGGYVTVRDARFPADFHELGLSKVQERLLVLANHSMGIEMPFNAIFVKSRDSHAAGASSLGQRSSRTNYLLLAGLTGLAASCANPESRPAMAPRQQQPAAVAKPEPAPVVSARPVFVKPLPRELKPGEIPVRPRVHGWMKSSTIDVDIFRTPRMAISFRTNQPRTIWVQFKNDLRQDLVRDSDGSDVRVELPNTQGQFQTIVVDLKKYLIPGVIDTGAVYEIILGDENANTVDISPVMYEPADGKSLGSAPKDNLDELTLKFQGQLEQILRYELFWEPPASTPYFFRIIPVIFRILFSANIAARHQRLPNQEWLKPREWIDFVGTKLNWIEHDLDGKKKIPFRDINGIHHQLINLMRQRSELEHDEAGIFKAYETIMFKIFWETILHEYDYKVEMEGEATPIPMSHVQGYLQLVRRVIPGLANKAQGDGTSAASLGKSETYGLKAARLEEAAQRNYPVPPFFVLTTDRVKDLLEAYAFDKKFPEDIKVFVREKINDLKRQSQNGNPFLVSVRSSEVDYRPGFMKSLLNVPADDTSSEPVLNAILEVAEWAAQHHVYTAVMVQTMVFGNQKEKSGTGILLTENPNTGRPEPVIQFLPHSQGPELTRGESPQEARDGAWLREAVPQIYDELITIAGWAVRDFNGPQEIEFTVENGKLYVLQILSEALPPQIALSEIAERALHGKITWASAAFELSESLSHKKLYALKPDVSVQELARGLAVSPGAVRGVVIISLKAAQEFREKHPTAEFIIADDTQHLIDALPELVKLRPAGIVTPDGASANHLASVARLLGIPYVAQLALEPNWFRLGSVVILDGNAGRILSDSGPAALEKKSVLSLTHLNIDLNQVHSEVERQKLYFSGNVPYNRLIAAHERLRQSCLELEKKLAAAKTPEEKCELASKIITQHLITHEFHQWVIARGNEYRQQGVRAAFRLFPKDASAYQNQPGWHNQRNYFSQHSFDLKKDNRGILLVEGVPTESWDPTEFYLQQNISRVRDLMKFLIQKNLLVSPFTIYESEASGDAMCTGMGVQFSPELEDKLFDAIIEFYTLRPDVKGSSLGDQKIHIPGTVWIPVQIVSNYADDKQIERDIDAGFFKRGDDGALWAPVIRDPSIVHPETIHGRSIHGESRVIKGAGIIEPVQGIPFKFDPYQQLSTQRFRGGETADFSQPAVDAALAIREAYAKALRDKDPVVLLARDKYGIQEAPVLKPIYLLRPLKIPVKENNGVQLVDPKEALSRVRVPDYLIQQQVMFIYEVPTNLRAAEWLDLDPGRRQRILESIYGKSFDPQKALEQFSARLALANYLIHHYLNGSFSEEIDREILREDQPPFVSSLAVGNVTLSGHVVDLDTAEIHSEDVNLKELQKRDKWFAGFDIEYVAERLKVSKNIGFSVYEELTNAKSTSASASSLGSKMTIPGAVWVPVEVIKNYADQHQLDRDIEAGFFKRGNDGSLWAPVIRDPSMIRPETIHGRSMHSEMDLEDPLSPNQIRAIKGCGLPNAVRGLPFDYDPRPYFDSQRFRGGETEAASDHAAQEALKIRRAYDEGLQAKDPVVLLARNKYGIQEAPVLKPLYLLRPLKIPVNRLGSVKLANPDLALCYAGVPKERIAQRAIFVYDVPLHLRLSEIYEGDPNFKNVLAVYGKSKSPAEILNIFSARLALANYLMHQRLNGTFTMEEPDAAEHQSPFVSSLEKRNVTGAGYVVDLDTASSDWGFRRPSWLQEKDEKFAIEKIGYFADILGVPENAGIDAYREVRDAKLKSASASSLGRGSDKKQFEQRIEKLSDTLANFRNYKNASANLRQQIQDDLSKADEALDKDQYFIAAQQLRKVLTRPDYWELLPISFPSNGEKLIHALERHTLPEDLVKWVVKGHKKKERYSPRRIKTFDSILARHYPGVTFDVLVVQMWRSLVPVLFSEGPEIEDPLEEDIIGTEDNAFELAADDFLENALRWIPSVNSYLAERLLQSMREGNLREVISQVLYLESHDVREFGGYGPVAWASLIHHYAMLASVEKNPRTPPAKASSLGKVERLVGGETNLKYLKQIERVVNGERDPFSWNTTALYLASGADISTALFATDADRLIFVDRLPFYPEERISLEARAEGVDYPNPMQSYLRQKREMGFANGSALRFVGGIRPFLARELQILGATNVLMDYGDTKRKSSIVHFDWFDKPRRLIFVGETDARDYESYADTIHENGGIDYFIHKSGEFLGNSFDDHANLRFVSEIVGDRFLNANGYLIFDSRYYIPFGDDLFFSYNRKQDAGLTKLEGEGAVFGYTIDPRRGGAYLIQKKLRHAVIASSLGDSDKNKRNYSVGGVDEETADKVLQAYVGMRIPIPGDAIQDLEQRLETFHDLINQKFPEDVHDMNIIYSDMMRHLVAIEKNETVTLNRLKSTVEDLGNYLEKFMDIDFDEGKDADVTFLEFQLTRIKETLEGVLPELLMLTLKDIECGIVVVGLIDPAGHLYPVTQEKWTFGNLFHEDQTCRINSPEWVFEHLKQGWTIIFYLSNISIEDLRSGDLLSISVDAGSLGKRPSREAQLAVARVYANRIILRGAASDDEVRSMLKALGVFESESPKELDPRIKRFNQDLTPVLAHLGIYPNANAEKSVPVILDDAVFPDSSRAGDIAVKLSQTMRAHDSLNVVWDGDKPRFVSELRRLVNHRFEVKDVRRKVLTDDVLARMIRRFDVAPIWISTMGADTVQVSFKEGDKIKLNLDMLSRHGIDPAQVVALLRQIADQPEQRGALFSRAGFTKTRDAWEVGEGFIAVLLNKIFTDRRAQQSLQRAA